MNIIHRNVLLKYLLMIHIPICILIGCVGIDSDDPKLKELGSTDKKTIVALPTMERKLMDNIFDNAVYLYGQEYLDAEMNLRNGGQLTLNTLRAKASQHPDPIAILIASCLQKWIQGSVPEFQQALDYLDYIPKRLAQTPAGVPRPIGVANDLNERFSSKVRELLALRLLKESHWPRWKTLGVIYYLKEQASNSTTSALIRFAAETQQTEM